MTCVRAENNQYNLKQILYKCTNACNSAQINNFFGDYNARPGAYLAAWRLQRVQTA